ncbi:hypothetical protein B0H11DRAFT_2272104 [Mycena galericulata]|nr:hypothetical protein B0H11DRAFT_2272104 [Mycena galericulata]
MPAFDPGRVYDEGSYIKAIIKAKADIEQDYPGCYVLIRSRQSTNIVADRFEIKARTWFGRTFGYDYYVLAEGLLLYDARLIRRSLTEPWLICTTTAWFDVMDTHRNRFGRTLFVAPANWMGDSRIDCRRFLSEFTLPGTHNSHATGDNVPFPTNIPGIKG